MRETCYCYCLRTWFSEPLCRRHVIIIVCAHCFPESLCERHVIVIVIVCTPGFPSASSMRETWRSSGHQALPTPQSPSILAPIVFSWFFSLSFFPFFESDFNFFMLFLNVAVQIENNQTIQVCAQTRAALRDLESCCWLSGSKQRRGLQGLSSGRSRGRRCRGATGGGEELGQQEVTGAKWHHPDHPDISPYTRLGRSKGGKKGVDVWHHFREKPLPPPQWHHNNGPISGW